MKVTVCLQPRGNEAAIRDQVTKRFGSAILEVPREWAFGDKAEVRITACVPDELGSAFDVQLECLQRRSSGEEITIRCACYAMSKPLAAEVQEFEERGLEQGPAEAAGLSFLQVVQVDSETWWQPPSPRLLKTVDWRVPTRVLHFNEQWRALVECEVVRYRLGDPLYFVDLFPALGAVRTWLDAPPGVRNSKV